MKREVWRWDGLSFLWEVVLGRAAIGSRVCVCVFAGCCTLDAKVGKNVLAASTKSKFQSLSGLASKVFFFCVDTLRRLQREAQALSALCTEWHALVYEVSLATE